MERTIKDPTFNIYKDGGNVETKGKELKKDELTKIAKDNVDLIFDLESGISDRIVRDFNKERKPGQSFLDWLDTKDRGYFLKIPLGLKKGGQVISISEYLKQKEPIKIKRINLDAAAPGRTLDSLTEAEREVVNKLLRMSFGKED